MALKFVVASLVFFISVAHGSCAAIMTVEIPTVAGTQITYTPSSTPCKATGRNLTADDLNTAIAAFRKASTFADQILDAAKEQYDTQQQDNCYFNLPSAFQPPLNTPNGSKVDILLSLPQFYFNLTRIALNTSITIIGEEQDDLELSPRSVYNKVWMLKDAIHRGTRLLKIMLNGQGYGCVADQHSSVMETTPIPDYCNERYVRLVRGMDDIHNTARLLANSLFQYKMLGKEPSQE